VKIDLPIPIEKIDRLDDRKTLVIDSGKPSDG
jgi:hypothetical protein